MSDELVLAQAASALAFLSSLDGYKDKVDDARKYLETVQAEASTDEYNGFVGCLEEFAKVIVFPIIRLKREFVSNCALVYLENHRDLILSLSEQIPGVLDSEGRREVAVERGHRMVDTADCKSSMQIAVLQSLWRRFR